MRKTDKKIEQQLCRLLTQVCEEAKDTLKGFEFISHQVNYQRFPNSLIIECYFINQESIDTLNNNGGMTILENNILQTLAASGFPLPGANKQIRRLIGQY